jgi:AraC family transcriptional regulator
MTKSILSPVEHGEPLDRLALDQIAMVLARSHFANHCGVPKFAAGPRRGLEAWQKLRTEEMLRAHLEGNITVKELANACSMSGSHFARCFRTSFGTSVHQRLIQLRIEYAKTCFRRPAKTVTGRVAIWLLRPGRFYPELQPHGAHDSVTLAPRQ